MGYKHTEETLKKMRDFILSDEVIARKRLSTEKATAARRISLSVKNIKTGEITNYKSLTELSKGIGVTKGAVSQALMKNSLIKKIYSIKRQK
jgi:O6-methylguanine-DNA--protein-cysteine methyltransferase